jgi:lactoylglutathione lyase
MISVQSLFEAHLTVINLRRSMKFYGETLGLELASEFDEPKVAFYWLGGPGQSMLGLWEAGHGPQRMSLHVAFAVNLPDLLQAPRTMRNAGIAPLDFARHPTEEPVVLAWMPAAALYFQDPDGNLLEYLSMLPDEPRPDLGVLSWSAWAQRQHLSK